MKNALLSLSCLISGFAVLLYMIFGPAHHDLIFVTETNSHSWTWLTAHFTHISVEHLIWNVAAFFILGSVLESYSKTYLLSSIVIGIIAVNIYLSFGYHLDAYAGLSGMLNCLFVSSLYLIYRFEPKMKTNCIVFLLLGLAKIIFEWFNNTSLFTSLVWQSVPQAHIAGFIGGIVFALFHMAIVQFKHGKITSHYRHS